MLCAFIGAGAGNFLRSKLIGKHFTLYLCVVSSVALACLAYVASLRLIEMVFPVAGGHEVGYICAMLFIIPGFPFITSGIDLAKLDMRSGLERLAYAVVIVVISTITAWVMSLILNLAPGSFAELGLSPALLFVFRLITSFVGVFGFSIMFNSPVRIAASAAVIGAVANTLRLELVDLAGLPRRSCRFYRSTHGRTARVTYDEEAGIPPHLCDRTVHRHHGAGTLSVPAPFTTWGDVADTLRTVACIRADDHNGAAAGADLRKDHNR